MTRYESFSRENECDSKRKSRSGESAKRSLRRYLASRIRGCGASCPASMPGPMRARRSGRRCRSAPCAVTRWTYRRTRCFLRLRRGKGGGASVASGWIPRTRRSHGVHGVRATDRVARARDQVLANDRGGSRHRVRDRAPWVVVGELGPLRGGHLARQLALYVLASGRVIPVRDRRAHLLRARLGFANLPGLADDARSSSGSARRVCGPADARALAATSSRARRAVTGEHALPARACLSLRARGASFGAGPAMRPSGPDAAGCPFAASGAHSARACRTRGAGRARGSGLPGCGSDRRRPGRGSRSGRSCGFGDCFRRRVFRRRFCAAPAREQRDRQDVAHCGSVP